MGIAPIQAMRQAGLTVALGTDGAASNNCQDMIETLKKAALLQKWRRRSVRHHRHRGTRHGDHRGCAGHWPGRPPGSLEPGKQADLFILDPMQARRRPFQPNRQPGLLGRRRHVSTVVVAGRVVLDGGRITAVDERAILAECQDAAWGLARRIGTDQQNTGR